VQVELEEADNKFAYVGSIGEAVQWAPGQPYQVQETQCIAKGDSYCRFEVVEANA